MNPFSLERAMEQGRAVASIASDARFLAGGTNLIDLMKYGVETPRRLIDINRLPLAAIEPLADGGLRLGALSRNSDTANHPLVRRNYPLLSRAILCGASPQLRNLASNGGNLLQRTRCPYFMDPAFPQCNKRAPGSGCGALEGYNRKHAIFGASEQCIAVNPSDMSVALVALEAIVRVQGRAAERQIPIADFHRLPGDTPQLDSNLKADELILSIDLPPSPYARHYDYIKVRDRWSYEFALVSVAAALEIRENIIHSARIVLGGVAMKPWRVERAEQLLIGQRLSADLFQAAGREAARGAQPRHENAYKIELVRRAVPRALAAAGGLSE